MGKLFIKWVITYIIGIQWIGIVKKLYKLQQFLTRSGLCCSCLCGKNFVLSLAA